MPITDDDLDDAARALIPTLNAIAERSLDPGPFCQKPRCDAPGIFAGRYIWWKVETDKEPTVTELTLCQTHAGTETVAFVGDRLYLAGRYVIDFKARPL